MRETKKTENYDLTINSIVDYILNSFPLPDPKIIIEQTQITTIYVASSIQPDVNPSIYQEIGKYLDNDFKPLKHLDDKDLETVIYLLKSINKSNKEIIKILKQIISNNQKSVLEDKKKLLNQLLENIFTEEQKILYDQTLDIIEDQNFLYKDIKSQIYGSLQSLNGLLRGIIDNPEAKEEYLTLISVAFEELDYYIKTVSLAPLRIRTSQK